MGHQTVTDAWGLTDSEKAEALARLTAPKPETLDERTASYLRFMEEAGAALAAPDPELEAERAVMAQHYAAPAEAHPYQPGDPDDLRDGLLAGFRAHRPAPASSPTSDEETRGG